MLTFFVLEFNVDTLISGLQGTFIYNLTEALAHEQAPLEYLEEHILAEHGFSNHLKLFRDLLDLTFEYSDRKYVSYQLKAVDRTVISPVVPHSQGGDEDRNLFVHSLGQLVHQPGPFNSLAIDLQKELPHLNEINNATTSKPDDAEKKSNQQENLFVDEKQLEVISGNYDIYALD